MHLRRSLCLVVPLVILVGCNSPTSEKSDGVKVTTFEVGPNNQLVEVGTKSPSPIADQLVLSERDRQKALDQCSRLRVGMTIAEVESVTGPIRENLAVMLALTKKLAAAPEFHNAEVTMTPVVTNGLVTLTFTANKAGEYTLLSFAALPAKNG